MPFKVSLCCAFLLGLSACSLFTPTLPDTVEHTQTAVSENAEPVQDGFAFCQYYYRNPEPKRLASALQRLYEAGMFGPENEAQFIVGFVCEALRGAPAETAALEKEVARFADSGVKRTLGKAFSSADTPEAYVQLKKIAQTCPELRVLVGREPEALYEIPPRYPRDLNTILGAFQASGKTIYLNELLQFSDEKKFRLSLDRKLQEISRLSMIILIRLGATNPDVLAYIKAYRKTCTENQEYELDHVLKLIDEYHKKVAEHKENPKKNPMPILPSPQPGRPGDRMTSEIMVF